MTRQHDDQDGPIPALDELQAYVRYMGIDSELAYHRERKRIEADPQAHREYNIFLDGYRAGKQAARSKKKR